MAWIALISAGLFEMLGVAMMNEMYRRKSWIPVLLLVVFFSMSFWLLSVAMETIAMGTVYAIWTGIGASGGAILGMVIYGESKDWKRICCIALIIGAVIGLKLIS
ncbi:MAG: multidrug efflux SMR transporter [Solibacillus sp.]